MGEIKLQPEKAHAFEIHIERARIGFRNRGTSCEGHYPVLHRLLNFMGSRGFIVGRDSVVRYKSISKNYWYGYKGALEFRAHRYPAGFEIEFFQNINFENPHGGRYDFNKYEKMPYLIKLLFRNEIRHIKAFLESFGLVDTSDPIFKYAYDKVVQSYVESWHKPQKEPFRLEELHGTTVSESYNNKDRDKNTLYNGQVKYFRDWGGRLARGTVYHNINNMWWVIVNSTERRNIASFELFDPTPEDFSIRRLKDDRKPESYVVRKAKLEEASVKELVNELKRRQGRAKSPF